MYLDHKGNRTGHISPGHIRTAKDATDRKVARATLKRRARLHNLKIKETGGDGHCLQYSVQDQLAQQGFDG